MGTPTSTTGTSCVESFLGVPAAAGRWARWLGKMAAGPRRSAGQGGRGNAKQLTV